MDHGYDPSCHLPGETGQPDPPRDRPSVGCTGHDGLAVGEIQRHLKVPASTLSYHIMHLVAGGLISQQREGRVLRCMVDYDRMQALVDMLTEECCAGVDATQNKKAG